MNSFCIRKKIDESYARRNAEILSNPRGVGLWVWKHLMQYKTLHKMNENDLLFYLDSEMACNEHTSSFLCLAQYHDVVPFHHSHPWYSISRLASRDSMILTGMDSQEVSKSVQYSGGTIMFRKTPTTIKYLRSTTAWSQQKNVVCCYGIKSILGEDYAEYISSGFMHPCDQAISSLMIIKYRFKSFPWQIAGFGGGSDDEQNIAQRIESNLTMHNLCEDHY